MTLGLLVHPHFLHSILPSNGSEFKCFKTLPLLIYFINTGIQAKGKVGMSVHTNFVNHILFYLLNPVNSTLGFINNIINDTCLNTSHPTYLFYCHEERTIVYLYLLPKRKDFSNNQTKLVGLCSLRKSQVFPEKHCIISDCS